MENGEAVLIRALEPVDGIGVMQERRGVRDGVKLCNGPAKLVQAMGIGREMNGIPVYRGDGVLRIEEGARYGDADIVTSRRIGVGKAVEELLRYYVKGNAYVSR
jgi:DNA-3-methyladenine glycosylase